MRSASSSHLPTARSPGSAGAMWITKRIKSWSRKTHFFLFQRRKLLNIFVIHIAPADAGDRAVGRCELLADLKYFFLVHHYTPLLKSYLSYRRTQIKSKRETGKRLNLPPFCGNIATHHLALIVRNRTGKIFIISWRKYHVCNIQ